ncbi:MAG TPA: RHS repeat domain-containing protein [Amycolatopsis sp.]|nr:RHS repeat domain-containing protein [Amycolatopsis sp.]
MAWESDFNGRERHYRYDSAGQLAEQVNAAGQTVRLTRDALGRVVRREDGEASTTYAFDAAGRLLNARNADAELAFVCDATGRVLTPTPTR